MTKRNSKKFQEVGVIRKRWRGKRSVALVFPDSYSLGIANLGFQRIYELINREDDVVAERFFYNGLSSDVRSLESKRHLSEFDLVIFSISFEQSYLNVAPFLTQAGIPPFRVKRSGFPFIVAGGICCQINPCPCFDLFDAFFLGDFEVMCDPLMDFILGADFSGSSKEAILSTFAKRHEWVLCPGTSRTKGVQPAIFTGTSETVPHTVVVSNMSSFKNTFLIELGRGCGRGCRFCAAGFVYRPPRLWSQDAIERTMADTKGAKKIGLVGLEYVNKGFVSSLSRSLVEKGYALGFSSLRADTITDEFVELLIKSKNYTATIAPEAGSERLRKVINKNLSEQQILFAAETFARAGLKNLKLYFMMGLPFEEDGDIHKICDLSMQIRDIMLCHSKGRGKMGSVIVSVSTFVPKPWTPFQWAPFISLPVLERRRKILKRRLLSEPNIKLRLDSVETAFLQAIISRGDEFLGVRLVSLALKKIGIKRMAKELSDVAENYLRERDKRDSFPWEVVNHRVKREYLLAQWEKAGRGQQTSFCQPDVCKRCGACGQNK